MFKNYINELKKTKTNSEWVKIKTNVLSFFLMFLCFLLCATIACVGEIIHLVALTVLGGVIAVISFMCLIYLACELYDGVTD